MARHILVLLVTGGVLPCFGYKAAFVEHYVEDPCSAGSCGSQTRAANVKHYARHAAEAAKKGAQIIVFPEYGITGESSLEKSAWVDGNYTETIPEPNGINPCTHNNTDKVMFQNAPSIVSLSCAAQKNKIALVANLMDHQAGKIYNTNVAFDTDGMFLAKYHKQNLWGEGNVDTPEECRESTFKTSFGVTFGMFICADLIYQHPALDLVRKGIKNFVVPVAWTNEMASLQTMPYAQGWSAVHGVNLIVSNLRMSTGSGSGIWSSGRTVASQYAPSSQMGEVVVAEVLEDQASGGSGGIDTPVLQPMDTNIKFDLAALASNSEWKFMTLDEGSARVCSGAVCCTVKTDEGSEEESKYAGFVLAALDGMDGAEGGVDPFPAQVCAVLPCGDGSMFTPDGGGYRVCLEYQTPEELLVLPGLHITMTGISSGSVVPEVLTASTPGTQHLLTNDDNGFEFSHKGQNASLHVTVKPDRTDRKLISALLYGRRFSKDTLPYKCSVAPEPEPEPDTPGAPDETKKKPSRLWVIYLIVAAALIGALIAVVFSLRSGQGSSRQASIHETSMQTELTGNSYVAPA